MLLLMLIVLYCIIIMISSSSINFKLLLCDKWDRYSSCVDSTRIYVIGSSKGEHNPTCNLLGAVTLQQLPGAYMNYILSLKLNSVGVNFYISFETGTYAVITCVHRSASLILCNLSVTRLS
jgi:hypothetical protein